MLRFDGASKGPTNLSLNLKVPDLAKALGINLSRTVDALLAEEVRRRLHAQWLERNRAAIKAYSERIEGEGTFSQQIDAEVARREPEWPGLTCMPTRSPNIAAALRTGSTRRRTNCTR